jgi:excisionase family DNA binding protein
MSKDVDDDADRPVGNRNERPRKRSPALDSLPLLGPCDTAERVGVPKTSNPPPEKLTYSAAEAASALGIGERKLWEMTNTRAIPHVRMGARVLYPIDLLRNWLAAQAEASRR